MKRILVVGIKGMAGHVIFRRLTASTNYKVYGIARDIDEAPQVFNLDVFKTDILQKIIKENHFDIIINCVGVLNRNAEDNPDTAIWLNAYFPHFLASIIKGTSTKLIQISTDCVFSGNKGNYKEDDFKDGPGVYPQSKALGEVLYEKHLTIRTSIIGPELKVDGIGLFHWFMQQKGNIRGYTEAIWTGLTTIELAKVIEKAIEEDMSGLYNITNGDKISKFDLIDHFKKIFDRSDIIIEPYSGYKTDKSLINSAYSFNIPSYEIMIAEMKEWILNHRDSYLHYNL